MNNELYMLEALKEARLALDAGELPIGCVIVKDGEIVSRAHNEREKRGDPTAHAEILAIRRASAALGDWRLNACTMFVTLEPCPMCAGAISQARIRELVYAAADRQYGCAGSVYRITEDPAFSHFCPAKGGLMQTEAAALISRFFTGQRQHDKQEEE